MIGILSVYLWEWMEGQLRVRILCHIYLCFNVFCLCFPSSCHFRHDCYIRSSNIYLYYCIIRLNTNISLLLILLFLPLCTLANMNDLSLGYIHINVKSFKKIKQKFNSFNSSRYILFYFLLLILCVSFLCSSANYSPEFMAHCHHWSVLCEAINFSTSASPSSPCAPATHRNPI